VCGEFAAERPVGVGEIWIDILLSGAVRPVCSGAAAAWGRSSKCGQCHADS